LQHVALPANARFEELRSVVMMNGKRSPGCCPPLDAVADLCAEQLSRLPQGCLRFINPHRYKVSMSEGLHKLRTRLLEEIQQHYGE